MSNKDWQIGPVLKDKLNSQGTLFRGGTKFSSDRRFPRGYNPERQREVADAVVPPTRRVYTDERGTQEIRGTSSIYFKDRRVRGSGSMSDDNMFWQSNRPMRDLVDNIARSTVPVNHLQGVQFMPGMGAITATRTGMAPAGVYTKNANNEPTIKIRQGAEQSHVPIHEIGHHVSHLEGTEHSRYDNPTRQGQEEAFADSYAFEHARNPRGRSMTGMRYYPSNVHSDNYYRQQEFANAYADARSHIPPPHNPMDKYRHNVTDTDNWKAWEQGQGSLFNIVVSGPDSEFERFEEHGPDSVPWKGYQR